MFKTIPIVVIIGPTGIGKTRLSVEVASAFNGEVISVDSIQVYRDCPIMAAQVTTEEMKDVPYHLVNYLAVDQEPLDFVVDAVRIVKSINGRGRVPVICGGSTSLLEPLLFHPFIMAQNVFILALTSDLKTVRKLCNDRIGQMLQDGLLDEVKHLYNLEKNFGLYENPQRIGAWKSIGYPELRQWCDAQTIEEAEKELEKGIELVEENTVRYAERQLDLMWKQLLPALLQTYKICIVLQVTSHQTFSGDVEIPVLRMCEQWLLKSKTTRHESLGFQAGGEEIPQQRTLLQM